MDGTFLRKVNFSCVIVTVLLFTVLVLSFHCTQRISDSPDIKVRTEFQVLCTFTCVCLSLFICLSIYPFFSCLPPYFSCFYLYFIHILGLKCHYAVPICHIEWDGDAGSFQCHLDQSTGHDTARYNNTLNVIAVLSRLGSALNLLT